MARLEKHQRDGEADDAEQGVGDAAPQPVGAQLLIDADGNFEGSVSGGCVEGAVITEAIEVIDSGRPRTLAFGVADETAWKVGLACGGRIRVLVEPILEGGA